jgi:hypothetical protein
MNAADCLPPVNQLCCLSESNEINRNGMFHFQGQLSAIGRTTPWQQLDCLQLVIDCLQTSRSPISKSCAVPEALISSTANSGGGPSLTAM